MNARRWPTDHIECDEITARWLIQPQWPKENRQWMPLGRQCGRA
jgi:hypothetical protein